VRGMQRDATEFINTIVMMHIDVQAYAGKRKERCVCQNMVDVRAVVCMMCDRLSSMIIDTCVNRTRIERANLQC
jgi:hypothetical protein